MAEAKQIVDKMFEAAIRCGGYIEGVPLPLPRWSGYKNADILTL